MILIPVICYECGNRVGWQDDYESDDPIGVLCNDCYCKENNK